MEQRNEETDKGENGVSLKYHVIGFGILKTFQEEPAELNSKNTRQ